MTARSWGATYSVLVVIFVCFCDFFFHVLTFAVARASCSSPRPQDRGFKLLPRDMANVNAINYTCVIVILAFSQ